MPTDLEFAITKRLLAQREAKIQKQLLHTLSLSCLILCLINLVAVIESPAVAAAVIYMGQLD